MGRGTIVSGGVDGRYVLERSRAPSDVAQRIERLQARRAILTSELVELRVRQPYLRLEVEEARINLEALLKDWQQRLAAGQEGDPPIVPGPDEDQADAVQGWESGLLSAHNLIRVQAGLGTLQLTSELSEAAQGHASWLALNDRSGHTGAGGSAPYDRMVAAGYPTGPGGGTGENQACGQTSVAMVMEGWMGSSGHRANILEGRFEDVGFGYAYRNGTTYRHFWVVNFGRLPS